MPATEKINITYYTDPLCCWSWAFEPEWQQLIQSLGAGIRYRYVMAGLLPDWKHYHDELFSVTRPVQMGPVWMQAAHLSGRYIYDKIWFEDPPSSSYPACIAVKAAAMQSFTAGELYLQYTRQAVMAEGVNISKETELVHIAEKLSGNVKGIINAARFKKDLYSDEARQAFKDDVQEVKYKGINRFPAILISQDKKKPLLFTGCKPANQLLEKIEQQFYQTK